MNQLRNLLREIATDQSIAFSIWEPHSPRLVELEQLLSETDMLDCFDENVHLLGISGSSISYKELASFLLIRALEADAQTAIEEIETYLASDTLSLEYAFLLPGIRIASNYQFSNGVRLLESEAIQDSNVRDELSKQSHMEITDNRDIQTILVAPYEVNKCYYPNTGPGRQLNEMAQPPHQLLDDTRLILSLARGGNYGIPLLASVVIIPRSLSFIDRSIGWYSHSEPLSHLSPGIIEMVIKNADAHLRQFATLNNATKDSLRIVLKRLNDVKIDSDPVNKLINLRVCLENLFLAEDEIYKITKKLKTRIPQHSTLTEIEVENYYSDMSTAVHKGKVPKDLSTPIAKIIQLIKKRILLVLETGAYPDW